MHSVKSAQKALSLSDIVDTLRQHKPRLRNQYGIRRLAVFGPYVRNEATSESEIGILIELGDKTLGLAYIDLVRDLVRLFPVKTRVITRTAIKPHYFAAIQSDIHDV